MRYDILNRYSNAQALTATAASASSIDHSEPRDLGNGEPVFVVCIVTTAFTDSGSDTIVTVTVETDSDSAFGSPTVVQTLGAFGAVPAAGSRLAALLQVDKVNERYSQLRYTMTTGGNLSTGNVTSFLCYDVQAYVSYPDAVTIH